MVEMGVEITEMPSKELLERFMSQLVLGQTVTISFNIVEGRFETIRDYSE